MTFELYQVIYAQLEVLHLKDRQIIRVIKKTGVLRTKAHKKGMEAFTDTHANEHRHNCYYVLCWFYNWELTSYSKWKGEIAYFLIVSLLRCARNARLSWSTQLQQHIHQAVEKLYLSTSRNYAVFVRGSVDILSALSWCLRKQDYDPWKLEYFVNTTYNTRKVKSRNLEFVTFEREQTRHSFYFLWYHFQLSPRNSKSYTISFLLSASEDHTIDIYRLSLYYRWWSSEYPSQEINIPNYMCHTEICQLVIAFGFCQYGNHFVQ